MLETRRCVEKCYLTFIFKYGESRSKRASRDRPFYSLMPGFVITGLICVLKWSIWLQFFFVITECLLTTEFVITAFHYIWWWNSNAVNSFEVKPHLGLTKVYQQNITTTASLQHKGSKNSLETLKKSAEASFTVKL